MKIGLALGGGGARGFSHIGVIKVLSAAGIECDIVTGTSIGALVGAAYAANNWEKLEVRSREIVLKEIPELLTPTISRKGFFTGKNAIGLLDEVVDAANIEDLERTFAAVSVDLSRLETVTFTSGDIRKAVRASMSIPVVFTPVIDGDRILSDGGSMEPVPVEAARKLGADFVIAVDLFGNYPPADERLKEEKRYKASIDETEIGSMANYFRSLFSKFGRDKDKSDSENGSINMIDVMERTLTCAQIGLTSYRFSKFPADVVIQPSVSHVGFLDFHRGGPIIEQGVKAAEEQIETVKALIAENS